VKFVQGVEHLPWREPPIGLAHHLQSMAQVRRTFEPLLTPLLIRAEWYRSPGQMSEVDNWGTRLCEIPIDKGDGGGASPHGVPGHQVAVAHDIVR